MEEFSGLPGSLLNYWYLEEITGLSGFLLYCNTAFIFVVDTFCINKQVLHPAKGRDGLVLWETLIYAVQQVLLLMARDAVVDTALITYFTRELGYNTSGTWN